MSPGGGPEAHAAATSAATPAALDRDLAPVELTEVALLRLTLPLVRPFTTSFGRQDRREVLLVRVTGSDGAGRTAEGWGECVAPAAPVYSEEFLSGAALVLRDHLVPALLAAPEAAVGAGILRQRLRSLRGHPMARSALEVAVLDTQLRLAGRSLATQLGAVRDRVEVGVSVGIPDDGVPALLEEVAGYLDAGYRRIKIKIRPGFDLAPVLALRTAFGADLPLQVDANAAYDPERPDHLAALDGLDAQGLLLLEQPFAPARLLAHARHAARWDTPVCLDESIHDRGDAADAIALGACRIVNIKPARVGGLSEALAIRDLCAGHGVTVWCGGMLETGVGRAANVALAATDGFALPGDLSASARYWRADLTEPFILEDGYLQVPTGPGIGRTPLADALRGADLEVLRH